jgi:2-C-methyl-D-erythritol 4-phosphate cytidylyltransferase
MGGVKKEYCPLPGGAGLTVLGAAVSAFASVSSVEILVICVPVDGEAAARKALPQELFARDRPRILFVPGGITRRVSVHHALSLLSAYNPHYVLIHDGARPWVSPSLIEQVIEAVKKHKAVIPLLPLTETPKETDRPFVRPGGPVFIKRHLGRARIGAAQTPQGFFFPGILAAHERAAESELMDSGVEYTDDAEVWGAFCGTVAVIPGSPENRKITFPEDLASGGMHS